MRPEGYYWVLVSGGRYNNGQPKIAEWSDGAWWFTGVQDEAQDHEDFKVIGERLEPPK